MKALLYIVGGVALGFVAAHLVNSTERGRALFGQVNDGASAFASAVKDGYDARTRELLDAIDR